MTSCKPRRARYAARRSGFTAVPVIQGNAAVVTIATDRPGSRSEPPGPGPAKSRPPTSRGDARAPDTASDASRRRSSSARGIFATSDVDEDDADAVDDDAARSSDDAARSSDDAARFSSSPSAVSLSSIAAAAASASLKSSSVIERTRDSRSEPALRRPGLLPRVSALSRAETRNSCTALSPASRI